MARFQKKVSAAQRVADKLAALDMCDSVDARREKKRMVRVPHKVNPSTVGEAWRGKGWHGAKGKTKRVHTPKA